MKKPKKDDFYTSDDATGKFLQKEYTDALGDYHKWLRSLTKDPKFRTWLHTITTTGYDHGIMIASTDSELIYQYWDEGQTPESAINLYKQFKKNESSNN